MNKKPSFLCKVVFGELSWRRLFRSILFIYTSLCIFALLGVNRLLFPAPKSSYKDSANILKLKTSDGMIISARYFPNASARYTILFSHGNGEDLGDNEEFFNDLVKLGFSVFAYDFHGYGTSQGRPTETNTYKDIDAAYAYLTKELKISPERIILHGRSIGTGPTVDLASRVTVAGMIVESPFLSAFRVVTHIPIFPFDRYKNLSKIGLIHVPVLIIHGRRDQVIPFSHGESLFKMANEPKRCLWVDEAGHNDLSLVAAKTYDQTLGEFSAFITTEQRATAKLP